MAFRFRPVYYNEVKSPFFIVNNTKSVYELSKICMSFFMFMLYGRLLNLLPTFRVQVLVTRVAPAAGLWHLHAVSGSFCFHCSTLFSQLISSLPILMVLISDILSK